jgi:hypothetical protein
MPQECGILLFAYHRRSDEWEPGGDFAGDFGFDGVEDVGGDGAFAWLWDCAAD